MRGVGHPDATVIRHSYTEGTLGVDIFDEKTRKPIWHGWVTKIITDGDRENPSPAIKKAVEALMRAFPPPV